nr:hypothetical protein [uncultured Prevotella sp.]
MKRNVLILLMSLWMHFTYAQSFDNVPIAIQKYILNNAKDDLDSLRRVQILDLFAKMKTAYDERDTAAIMSLYGDRVLSSMNSYPEMLDSLPKCSKIKIDAIKVQRSPNKQGFYGITIHQAGEPVSLKLNGYLLLLLSFHPKESDEKQLPLIHCGLWRLGDDESQAPSINDIFIPD